jgi:hypothetical protein
MLTPASDNQRNSATNFGAIRTGSALFGKNPPGRSKQQKADDHPKPLDSPTDHFVTLGLSGGGPKRPFLVNGSLNDWLGGERVKDSGCKSREKPGNQRG